MSKKDKRQRMMINCIYMLTGGTTIKYFLHDDKAFYLISTTMQMYGIYCLTFFIWTISKYNRIFKGLKLGVNEIYPLVKSVNKTDSSTIYSITLPAGLSTKNFEDNKQAIEQYIGKDIDIKYTYKEIQIEEFNEKMKTYYEYTPTEIKGDVPLIVGYDRKGKLIECDISIGEPHVLIAGETGSGKSTVLRTIITNFILMSNVKLHLIDLKMGTEFNIFRNSNKVYSFCKRVSEATTLLQELDSEVERRYNLFYDADCKDIKEYNKKYRSSKLDYEVLVVDEFSDLQGNKDCLFYLDELGRKARACGIHLILSTQRPSANVLNGNIKANITNILGLKTLNATNSQIIIGNAGLEKLNGKGHGKFKRGSITEVQTPFLDTDRCRELIKHTYIDKRLQEVKEEVNFDNLEVLE